MVQAIREGTRTLTPHLSIAQGASKAIEFYKRAFGAEVGHISEMPGGKIMHAALKIGDSQIFVNDLFGPPPGEPNGTFVINLAVEDANATWKRAVDAGATVVMPLQDQFWGDRYGHLKDPFGFVWAVNQHIEDLTPEQMQRRGEEALKQFGRG